LPSAPAGLSAGTPGVSASELRFPLCPRGDRSSPLRKDTSLVLSLFLTPGAADLGVSVIGTWCDLEVGVGKGGGGERK
jgi:hypothetical protein